MLRISFTDFWEGFDENNNLFTNILKEIFETEIIITRPSKAEVCFITIYGRNHKNVISKYREKCILFLGENIRPNIYDTPYTLSSDFNTYNGKNMRLPLWYLDIDWFNTNIGIIKSDDVERKLVSYGKLKPDNFAGRKDCITIFNNPEGTRMDMLEKLNKIMSVEAYGKPFKKPLGPKIKNNNLLNAFNPVYCDYHSKIKKMSEFKFNLCPENSLYPGYYPEKCLHAKISGCIPIYFADSHVDNDFRKESFINMYDYLDFENLIIYLISKAIINFIRICQ